MRLILIALLLLATPVRADESWRPPRYPVPAGAVRLAVPPDPAADAAPAINAVLAELRPGQTLLVPAGTWRIGEPLLVPSGVHVQGTQAADGALLSRLEQLGRYGKFGPLNLGLMMNAGYRAEAITDRGIRVTALAFRHESTGVLFRMVEDVVIEGCSLQGGGDGTAVVAGRRSLVSHSLALDTRNAAFDHWSGAEDATVTDSVAIVANGHGILFNAADTQLAPRTARNFTALRNSVRGMGRDAVGIWVSPLGHGGSRIGGRIVIADNRVGPPQPGVRAAGILVNAGDADEIMLHRNTVVGIVGYGAIAAGPNRPQEGHNARQPARIEARDNIVRDSRIARTAGGAIRLWGGHVAATGNSGSGNTLDGAEPAPPLSLCAGRTAATEPHQAACDPP